MAGSSCVVTDRIGYKNGSLSPPFGKIFTFTTDDTDATIPPETVTGVSGFITSAAVVMSGTVPPTSVILDITSLDGISLSGFPATLLAANGWALAPGDYPPIDFSGGFIVKGTVVGNSKVFQAVVNYI